jgi:hypothetical protein
MQDSYNVSLLMVKLHVSFLVRFCSSFFTDLLLLLSSMKFFSYSILPVISAVNNLPMGYPVLQQPGLPAPGQPHVNAMACGPPGYHIANGIPYHPIRMSSENG